MNDDLATRLDERLKAMQDDLRDIKAHLEKLNGRTSESEKAIIKLQTWVALVAGIGSLAIALGAILSVILK